MVNAPEHANTGTWWIKCRHVESVRKLNWRVEYMYRSEVGTVPKLHVLSCTPEYILPQRAETKKIPCASSFPSGECVFLFSRTNPNNELVQLSVKFLSKSVQVKVSYHHIHEPLHCFPMQQIFIIISLNIVI